MRLALCALALTTLTMTAAAQEQTPDRPNIIVIVSDDAGYADFSMHGSEEMSTPHIDSIAAHGVRFSNGYVSASVCSPSRAGLLTGRYQQRFGHEFNIPATFSEVNGLPTDEVTLANMLHQAGYRTIALGKWHLGYADHFHPLSRGFDDFFGFLQGARSYWSIEGTTLNRLLRDREPITEDFTYMTDELGRQAATYIAERADESFFMYLAFNAVHTPMHAEDADLTEFEKIEPRRRRTLAAMTRALDEAVGTVLDALNEHGVQENTIVFFINDNGGATNNACSNAPLRGHKGQMFEGGIRVPFAVQWPARVPQGVVTDDPVISLDIAPTVLAAAGVTESTASALDGTNLLPNLLDPESEPPTRTLFWREGEKWAVRRGDWKLLRQGGQVMLFNLADDPHEKQNLLELEPGRAEALGALFDEWNAPLAKPRWRYGKKAKPAPGSESPKDNE